MDEALIYLMGWILDRVFSMGTGMGERLKFITAPDTATDLKGFTSAKAGDVLLGTVNSIWQYLMIIGIGMTIIYFLLEMNQKIALEGRDMTIKSMFAPFLKLFVALVVLSQGANIMSWILAMNDSMIDGITALISDANANTTQNIITDWTKTLKNTIFMVKLIVFAPLILTWIITLVCQLVWWYKTLTYKLEFLFRIAITPVALADVYSGNNSNAFKWLKGFLALELYGISMCVIPSMAGRLLAFDAFQADGIWDFLAFGGSCLLIPIASLGIMSTIRTATKEALN